MVITFDTDGVEILPIGKAANVSALIYFSTTRVV